MTNIASHTPSQNELAALEAMQEKVNSIWSLRISRLLKDKAAIMGALILFTLLFISY